MSRFKLGGWIVEFWQLLSALRLFVADWLFPKFRLAELLSLTQYKTKSFGLDSSSRTQPKSKPTLLLKSTLQNKDVGFKKK